MYGGFYFKFFYIKYSWLGFVLSVISAAIVIKTSKKNLDFDKHFFSDLYWNGFIIWLFVYKFANLLFSPIEMIQKPIELIFSAPNPHASILAWVITIFYGVSKAYRKRISFLYLIEIYSPAIMLGLGIYSFFNLQLGSTTQMPWGYEVGLDKYHPLFLYRGLLLCVGFIVDKILVHRYANLHKSFFIMCLSVGIAYLVPTLFQTHSHLVFYLTMGQWVEVGLISIGIYRFLVRKDHS